MKATKNDCLIKALMRQPHERIPIWIMRQAGRYLPEYRALRQQTPDFMTFCKTSELAAQATLQPLARFDLDAAIVFSDILVVPEAMGADLHFAADHGPVISNPTRNQDAVNKLKIPDPQMELRYVMDTIGLVRKELAERVPLIGFAGSPWTCATYMVEGGGSKTFQVIKSLLYQQPSLIHQLLQKITDTTIQYINAQIVSGAQVIMIFDTWGGILGHQEFKEFSLYYLMQIAEQIIRQLNDVPIPLIFFTKGASPWLAALVNSGCDALGLDWTIDLAQAQKQFGHKVALQGNLDPCILLSNPQRIEKAVADLLQQLDPRFGHVFNLGHGIYKETPIEHVQCLVEAVHRRNYTSNRVGSLYI